MKLFKKKKKSELYLALKALVDEANPKPQLKIIHKAK